MAWRVLGKNKKRTNGDSEMKKKKNKHCTIQGCTKPIHAKGYCNGHYLQVWRCGKIIHTGIREHTDKQKQPEYQSWIAMKKRCYDKNNPAYKYYGGRGIKVCDRWLDCVHGFDNFLEDMGRRPEGCSLDKIDNDKDYGPGNCRWADRQTQSINRRSVKEPYITIRNTKNGKRYDVRIRDLSCALKYKYKRGVFANLNDAIAAREIFIRELRGENYE